MMYCVMTGENKGHHGYISGTLMTKEKHTMGHPGQVAQCLCQVYYILCTSKLITQFLVTESSNDLFFQSFFY